MFRRIVLQPLCAFVSRPASPRPLAVLRIGLAAVLLAQAYTLAGSLLELYGSLGFVQWSVDPLGSLGGVPRVGWLVDALAPYGVSDVTVVRGVFLAYVGSLACLLLGWHTRVAAVLAWLTHTMLKTSGNTSIYGVDEFAHIALFYCVFMPVGHALSLDRLAGRVRGEPSAAARLALRVLQLHLCVAYVSSGIHKAVGEQWWDGEAVWRSLMRPDLGQFDMAWLADAPWVAMLACWGTLLVELGYPLLVWPRWWRKLGALATIGLHVGIAVGLGLVSFAAVMIVLNVAAFLVRAEPAAEPQTSPATRTCPVPGAV
jgi:Vitamin K-dependent gamma-carboxylase